MKGNNMKDELISKIRMPKMRPTDSKFLTIPQVAEELQVSERTVWRWIKDKELIVHRHGRWTRVHCDELERFLKLARDA